MEFKEPHTTGSPGVKKIPMFPVPQGVFQPIKFKKTPKK